MVDSMKRLNKMVSKFIPVFLFATVFLFWAMFGVLPFHIAKEGSLGHMKPNEIGDMFGMTNALFAGLAFAGVIWALVLQSKELRLQRRQLSLQARELKRSANSQEQTVQTIHHTAFLNVLNSIMMGHAQNLEAEKDRTFQPSSQAHREFISLLEWSLVDIGNRLPAVLSLPDRREVLNLTIKKVSNRFCNCVADFRDDPNRAHEAIKDAVEYFRGIRFAFSTSTEIESTHFDKLKELEDKLSHEETQISQLKNKGAKTKAMIADQIDLLAQDLRRITANLDG